MGKIMSFSKQEVIGLLQSLEQPTPTDSEHQAHWWNEQFGMKIKAHFFVMMQGVCEQIERSKPAQ